MKGCSQCELCRDLSDFYEWLPALDVSPEANDWIRNPMVVERIPGLSADRTRQVRGEDPEEHYFGLDTESAQS